MSSFGSISNGSTVQATGNGSVINTISSKCISNKMKLDMPPRPVKTNNRRQQPLLSSSSAGGAAAPNSSTGGGSSVAAMSAQTASAPQGVGNESSVPHVVRVTFLGVAGLMAKQRRAEGGSGGASGVVSQQGQQSAAEQPSSLSRPISAPTASPASADHPSLLFPLPSNLRVVASVSRSRTARGIPSGMSKPLAPPANRDSGGGGGHRERHPSSGAGAHQSSAIGSTPGAGGGGFSFSPVAGESILVEKNHGGGHPPQSATGDRGGNSKLSIDEISVARDASAGHHPDSFDEDGGRRGHHRRKGSRSSHSHSASSLSPPSQLLHSRTNSRLSRTSEGNAGRGEGGSPGGSQRKGGAGGPDPTEGIEVIRPVSPSEGILGGAKKMLGLGSSGSRSPRSGEEAAATEAAGKEEEERYVAVWDDLGNFKPPNSSKLLKGEQQHQFVNLTNSLAFEAELRPSSVAEKDGRATPVASTSFAPKSFCVSVGLVPDFEGENTSQILDDLGEMQSASSAEGSGVQPSRPPTFAIPVGFADLVINGDETLDGKRKQIDLPLSSLRNFVGSLPEREGAAGASPVPLIELTAEGLAGGRTGESDTSSAAISSSAATVKTTTTGKTKKKSIVKRMFSRKALQQHAVAAGGKGGEQRLPNRGAASPLRLYDGHPPRSIFHLGRAPIAEERALFLERYGVDPGGDAVVRIGLEVFPRGSELEKIFRQKNKLRKKAAAVAAASGGSRATGSGRRSPRLGGTRPNGGRYSPSPSLGSRTHDTGDSRSLMDDDDETFDELDSECDDSVFSQSFFTLDSDASRTTWDESTMYTDALSSFNTMDDDSVSYTTGFTDSRGTRRGGGGGAASALKTSTGFLANFLNCNGPTSMTCGVDEDDDDAPRMKTTRPMPSPYANFDKVADAIASMSMAEEESTHEEDECDTPRTHGGSGSKDALRSVASMDTATRANHRTISPDSIKESGEELTLDSTASNAGGESGSAPPPSPLETSFPIEGVKSSITIQNEMSPLATIKQRFAESRDERDKSQRGPGQAEEGHEFTLEEHQSSM